MTFHLTVEPFNDTLRAAYARLLPGQAAVLKILLEEVVALRERGVCEVLTQAAYAAQRGTGREVA